MCLKRQAKSGNSSKALNLNLKCPLFGTRHAHSGDLPTIGQVVEFSAEKSSFRVDPAPGCRDIVRGLQQLSLCSDRLCVLPAVRRASLSQRVAVAAQPLTVTTRSSPPPTSTRTRSRPCRRTVSWSALAAGGTGLLGGLTRLPISMTARLAVDNGVGRAQKYALARRSRAAVFWYVFS